MVRFSLSDLEEALNNPVEYMHKQTGGGTPEFIPRKSYYTVLKNAIFKFHKAGHNLTEGQGYLIQKLTDFKDEARIQDTMEQFLWYIQDYQSNNLVTFSCRHNVIVQPSLSPSSNLEWSGQVSRLDIRRGGGYAAWLFRSHNPEDWYNELRMPLIQNELSNDLSVPLIEISIGIYSFEERYIDHRCYSTQNVADAQQRLQNLSVSLGL